VKTIDLTPNWKRAKYKDLVREKAGADWFEISPAERRQRAHDLGAEIGKEYVDYEVTGAVFEKLIEPTLIQPTFVTHLPKNLCRSPNFLLTIRPPLKFSSAASTARKFLRATPNKTIRLPSAPRWSIKQVVNSKNSMKIFWLPLSTECLRLAESESELTGFA